jgi:hypothetical protein
MSTPKVSHPSVVAQRERRAMKKRRKATRAARKANR